METVVITGANRGIGLALTKKFLLLDKHVIATCRDINNAEQLTALSTHGKLTISALEVTSEASVSTFCEQLIGVKIDILINNAGTFGGNKQNTKEMDYTSWLETFSVNTLAPFRLSTALKTNLLLSDHPRIVSISSLMASLVGKGQGSYAYRSSKAALNKVMQVMALEYKAENIIVCPVHPGWVKTDMGGSEADISVEQSRTCLVKLINNLTLEQSGRFWQWDGQELDW
ncbi:SDR family oxidoreductase [Psychromonas sp. Urea-02u-13]|uniref:SDR family oxidoreductase n=1 Tax=Psychromonas sp. Urea-02u-13 TaxID=2058326 RepID=UPI000C34A261|nr:SDR family oxidoreductase [Psychromonas sp. Urea-02u-13]PKG39169.1 Short chain dehydrogenase [Psychromonas sp. Urea-02u-13]